MTVHTRREFLGDVGKGMILASVGATLAGELGIRAAIAGSSDDLLSFGPLEPLASLMQETPPARLQPLLVEKLRSGVDLRTLTAAGALANARTFGGQDYDGYHAFMAMMPAYEMTKELPEDKRALPILKVLYRNASFMQTHGGRSHEVLHRVGIDAATEPGGGELLRSHLRKREMNQAERAFAKMADKDIDEAYNNLQFMVQETIDVHQVVLAWRAWETLQLTGAQHAHTLLRTSVRHCVDREESRVTHGRPEPKIRKVLPAVLDRHRLLSRPVGTREADDRWVDELSFVIFKGSREEAADAVGAALAEEFSPDSIGEAISLAANRLLLHDPGRSEAASEDKPRGSVHGASVGVHACDSANAWRHIAKVTNHRNAVASLVIGAYHTAGQMRHVRESILPFAELSGAIATVDGNALLAETESAIRDKDQARVCAVVDRYGGLGHGPRPLFDLLLKYAISEDGALHAEKYYRTVAEEFRTSRPAFRWRQLTALARVTASEYGFPAPGREQAQELLGIT